MDPELQLVIAHYRMMFPTKESLGTGEPPIAWLAEYQRVAACGLAATLITGTNFDTGSASGQRNFPQTTVMRGLLIVRAEHDPLFDDKAFEPPRVKPRRTLGFLVRLSSGAPSYSVSGEF